MVRDDTQREKNRAGRIRRKKILKLQIITPHFFHLKSLVLRKQHHQTTKPTSPLHTVSNFDLNPIKNKEIFRQELSVVFIL